MFELAALPAVHFVIGLREGVEAALIVGIIGTFLHQQGRSDALRWMWAGVGLAVVLCASVAVVLQLIDEDLPQRQQEGFEAIVGLIAVVMVSSMIVYMRRHARSLGRELRTSAAGALAVGSAWSLVAMAFLAVMREGLETAMFLLAAFQSSAGVSPAAAGAGAVAGLAVATGIGLAIYRFGARINLARFFKVTAVLLVVISAGLISSALHHAAEAGLITVGQDRALDLSGVIVPSADSITSGLITGLLGVYPFPTVAEVVGWLVYAIPMLTFVLWPQRPAPAKVRRAPSRQGQVEHA
jgi:high-affinity iron transporter